MEHPVRVASGIAEFRVVMRLTGGLGCAHTFLTLSMCCQSLGHEKIRRPEHR